MRVTRAEVAKLAGVSGPTVSYVFNKTRHVSEELEKRVREAAKQLNYHPDLIARSMVTKETKTISILTDDISNPLMIDIVKGIQESAISKGYFVNICGGDKNLEAYIDNFISRRVDGVFISVTPEKMAEEYVDKLLSYDISVVEITTRYDKDARICKIETDFEEGMSKIIHYLKKLNHRKIVYLSAFDEQYPNDKRLEFFKSLYQKNFELEEPVVIKGIYPYESTIQIGYELAAKLISSKKKFTAVICTNDLMAIGAIKALSDSNLRVPEDVSVVGIDNIVISNYVSPSLTTLDTQSRKFGERILEIMYDNMKKGIVRCEVFGTELVIRKSCGLANPERND